jgi:hypothetical protein
MDNTERLIQKRTLHTEETFAVEFSDLPALSDPFGHRSSWLAQMMLDCSAVCIGGGSASVLHCVYYISIQEE